MNAQHEWMMRDFDIESLQDLASKSGGSFLIVDIPMVTIDGINHVTKIRCSDGYDCWRYSDRAKTGNVMHINNITKDVALSFLIENIADCINKNTKKRHLSKSQRAQVMAQISTAMTQGTK